MKHCDMHREELDAVAAGGIPSEGMVKHLRDCQTCTAALKGKRTLLERIDVIARAWMAAEPPTHLADAVFAGVRSQERPRVRVRLWWMAAAAAVVAFGIYDRPHHAPMLTAPVASAASAVLSWRSATARLARLSDSVLDIRSPGRLLDLPAWPYDRGSGGNHAN